MPDPAAATVVCSLCGQSKPRADCVPGKVVRESVAALIRKDHPDWSPEGCICYDDLQTYRSLRVRQLVEEEMGTLSETEAKVVKSLEEQVLLARNVNDDYDSKQTFGQHIADRVAEFGGSWAFIFAFGGMIVCWMTLNAILLARHPFDPYPFMALNLVLSCLAAIQAPVIMMSQNRQESKDRMRAEHDYEVNLKAELEIRSLSARIDELLRHQWQGLLEIQQLQAEMMEELVRVREAHAGA